MLSKLLTPIRDIKTEESTIDNKVVAGWLLCFDVDKNFVFHLTWKTYSDDPAPGFVALWLGGDPCFLCFHFTWRKRAQKD
ncbi:hypothetical protein A7B51_09145 [Lentilactobacillus parabuchneri]|nr:hypothetical protein [Lentilactobacillus parabuchneri]OBU96560.1 hypothetical protein A7B51_09145 [Lentilactobacillus parabuchneri]OCB81701.1 hypothetical protein A7322_11455 [Lentilactobacillus parabuchneri]